MPDDPESDQTSRVSKEQDELSTEPFPNEGGLRGWTTVLGAWLVFFCGFGYSTSFGVYQDYYNRIYLTDYQSSEISWIGSVQVFLLYACGLVTGRLFDQGYFYYIVYCGAAVEIFSLFMLSLARENQLYQIILSQGIGVGIGAGMLYVPCVAIVGHYFKRRRTLAMAIVTSGSSIGGVIHPIMLNRLLRSDLGFANSVRASAGLVSGVLLLAACLMRTNAPKTASTPFLPAMRKFSRDWVYLFVTLGGFLFSVGFYFPIFYIQLDANKHHVDSSFAFYSIVVLNASSSVGRILPGFIARYIGIINMLCMCCIGCSAVVFGMIGLQSLASVAVIGVIYGLFSGAYIGLLAPMVSLLSDSPSELGIRMGFAFTMQGLGGLIGTPLVGAVLTREYIWSHGAVCAGVFCIGGTASYMMARVLMEFRKAHRDDKRTGHAVE